MAAHEELEVEAEVEVEVELSHHWVGKTLLNQKLQCYSTCEQRTTHKKWFFTFFAVFRGFLLFLREHRTYHRQKGQ